MYWDAMTAPPVAKEENSVMSKKLMESTREMPETAASPQEETITVSAIPMVTARSCSITRGMMSFRRSLFENTSSPHFNTLGSLFAFLGRKPMLNNR